MKKRSLLFLLVFFCSIDSSIFAQKSGKLDTFGYYYIERSPREFADISEIHLSGNYGASQKPPFHGLIRLKRKSAKDFHLYKPKLSGKNLSFSTKSVGGISYTFNGTFTKLFDAVISSIPGTPPEGIVLRGKLSKFRGKSKIAEANVGFTYFAGD